MENIGKRIKARRKQLGLSAEQIAERMGVSPATVYRYESNYISNMKVDKISPIAKVLKTSEAFLMGWTNNPNPIGELSITVNEQNLLSAYRSLNPDGKHLLTDYADTLVASGKYDPVRELDTDIPRNAVAAHDRTDIEATDEMRKFDDEIMEDDDF